MADLALARRIGENVRAARLKANITQECLAEIIGVHWQTVSNIENGKSPLSAIILFKLAQALQTSPNRLFEGLPQMPVSRIERIKKMMARKRAPKGSGQK